MSEASKRKKPYVLTAVLGIMSIVSYALIFTNQPIVTEYATKGGLYAALPISAAFYFSFIHGAFASNILSILGIEAARKKK